MAGIDLWLGRLEQMDPRHVELGLERVRAVWQRMPSLPATTRVVTVAGTNGKGSTLLLLEYLLRAQGLRVSAYLSPHLVRFNERIRHQEKDISDEDLCLHFQLVENAREGIALTYFEFTTLAALSYFSACAPDVLLLEVGLGGRLDAVNILDADIAVITSVDLDHQDWLGADRESIGREKAGIFRPHRAALFCSPDMPESVASQARTVGARLLQLGKDFRLDSQGAQWRFSFAECSLSLPVLHNSPSAISATLATCFLLTGKLVEEDVARLALVPLPGRFQQMKIGGRDFVLDVAHNPAASARLASMLGAEVQQPLAILLGVMNDKDVEGIVAALAPRAAAWLLVKPATPRAASRERLLAAVTRVSQAPILATSESISEIGLEQIPGDMATLVTGSFYTVGEFLTTHCGGSCA